MTKSWLWSHPIVFLGDCSGAHPTPGNQAWSLLPNGTLRNENYGCVEVSFSSGPPSTLWSKPLRTAPNGEGPDRVAVLVINGADLPQEVGLNWGPITSVADWAVRDVWAAKDLGHGQTMTRTIPPHDCLLLVLSDPT